MHQNKDYNGYYLLYGHYHGPKDPMKAKQLFKEAADEHNHSEILHYLESATGNSKNPSIDAMYYLGDIYVGGKLRVKKDEERGLNYLRVAASNQNERAIALLAKLGK
ncbi:1023_t:CDS:2 [Gigaspora margarita]|uniref:1023_t:CDS:1 n=1 Tax=Gigaspora margarita TaxID=4874 RepID=A0ABN7UV51_GIGMA|nr:1023_t:CDS:2 [Gigaspora margarita]